MYTMILLYSYSDGFHDSIRRHECLSVAPLISHFTYIMITCNLPAAWMTFHVSVCLCVCVWPPGFYCCTLLIRATLSGPMMLTQFPFVILHDNEVFVLSDGLTRLCNWHSSWNFLPSECSLARILHLHLRLQLARSSSYWAAIVNTS